MELQTDQLGKVAVTVDDAYWDIRKDYDKLVIVEVKDKYRTYISRKPVPAGTSLSNRKYWIPFSSLVEEIKLNYGKWFSTYGNLLGSNALILNKLQLELNNLLKNLSGIYLSADKDCIEIGTSTIVTLSFGTNNKEDGDFKLYKNNELIFEARNNSFELQEGVTSTTEFRLECVQNGISYTASWNVAEVAPYYIGSGINYNDVLGNSNFKKGAKLDISGLYDINVDEDGKYFFICVPIFIVLDSVKMNGYDVPMQSTITVTEPDTNIEYKIWQSSNTYREGLHNIQINKYKGEESDLIYSLIEQVGTYSKDIQEANDKSQEALNNSIVADNEDIEKDSNRIIRFANKDYNPKVFSGLGRIYLRKNIVDNNNVLTQDMINKPNTIYHIQYDYDLNSQTITVPEGCTLEFEGGSFANGKVVFTNTIVNGSANAIFKNIQKNGNYKGDTDYLTEADLDNYYNKEDSDKRYTGIGEDRPVLTVEDAGRSFFDTTTGLVIWNGTKWVDTKGMTAGVHKGNTEYRGGMPIGTLTEADWYGTLDSTPEFNGFKNGVVQTQGDGAGTGTPHAIYFDRIKGKFLFESEDPNIPGNYLYWEKWVGSTYIPFINPTHSTIYKENDNYWKYIAPKTNATLKLDPATDIGYEYFDIDLGKMVYAKSIATDGTASWVDANGMSC